MDVLIFACLAFAGAVVPTVMYVYLVYWLDRYEREPLWLLTLAFLWGAVPAIVLAIIPQMALDSLIVGALGKGRAADALTYAVSAPLTEEAAKGIFLIGLLLLFWQQVDDPLDGIVYGAMVGFGFALPENVLYFAGAYGDGGVGGLLVNIILRNVLFGFNHAFFTACTGLGLGWARSHVGLFARVGAPVAGWLAAVTFHGLHNLGASLAEATACLSFIGAFFSDWIGILAMLALMLWFLSRQRRWLVDELRPELASGLLTADEYAVVVSSSKRASARLSALFTQGWGAYRRLGKFFAAATDLAFTKHQLRSYGEERGNSAEIARLRERLRALRGAAL
ncbi:MAG: PrsW family intramembrane metalloprotease [Chloroflexi bacterium]|nr:PrsW family intramembrane metalloprotease [Chloroflexota bacterium]